MDRKKITVALVLFLIAMTGFGLLFIAGLFIGREWERRKLTSFTADRADEDKTELINEFEVEV